MSQGRNGGWLAVTSRRQRTGACGTKSLEGATASALAVVGTVTRWNGGARVPSGELGAPVAVAGWQREEVRATSAAKKKHTTRQTPEGRWAGGPLGPPKVTV